MKQPAPVLTLAACLLLVAAATMCVSPGDDGGDAGPVGGVTLIVDFGSAKAPVHDGNLSVWTFTAGTNNTVDSFTSEDNDGRAVMVFRDISSEEGTVLGITEAASRIAGLGIETKSYAHGLFVEAIGGVDNDKDGDNWLYWLEGLYGNLASDRTELDPGELVIWRYMDPADVDGDSGAPEAMGLDPEEVDGDPGAPEAPGPDPEEVEG